MALLKLISDAKLLTVRPDRQATSDNRTDLISERLYKLTLSNKAILCKAREPSERKSIKPWAFLATLFMMFPVKLDGPDEGANSYYQLTTLWLYISTIYHTVCGIYSQLSIYLAIRLSIIYNTLPKSRRTRFEVSTRAVK